MLSVPVTAEYSYPGTELELFASALNWKRYVRSRLVGFIGQDVLEVGAGLGETTAVLCTGPRARWVCLEPDGLLRQKLASKIDAGMLPPCCDVSSGTIRDFDGRPRFDTVLYADVLEHIEDHRAELAFAGQCLKPGGHIIVLAPAHQWLFTPFDKAIGHYRRYSASVLRSLTPSDCVCIRVEYLDSVGILASLANRLLLNQSAPTFRQIQCWDRVMVPCSRVLDPIFGRRLGKSVLAVWRKNADSR